MLRGRVTSVPELVVPVCIIGPGDESIEVDAIVDTGFTDDVALPSALIRRLGLPLRASMPVSLADGSLVNLGVYTARMRWSDEMRGVLVFSLDSDPLIGLSALGAKHLAADIVEGGVVTIDDLG